MRHATPSPLHLSVLVSPVLQAKGEKKWPNLSALLVCLDKDGTTTKSLEIAALLKKNGCTTVEAVVDFMQAYAQDENMCKGLGRFAYSLEKLGLTPFDALEIAECIGDVILTMYHREVHTLMDTGRTKRKEDK